MSNTARPSRVLSIAAALAALASFAWTPASADEAPVQTAGGEAAPASGPAEVQDLPPVRDDAAPAEEPAEADRKVHGQVEAAVGTGGYRRVSGVVSVPVGETGQVVIGVEKSERDWPRP